jgi:hypothetical protein
MDQHRTKKSDIRITHFIKNGRVKITNENFIYILYFLEPKKKQYFFTLFDSKTSYVISYQEIIIFNMN